jgi:hypothetical protein
MAKDRDITITSFSAGQTNTRAKKDFRMSSLLNILSYTMRDEPVH